MLKNKLVVYLDFVEQFRNTLIDLVWTNIAQAVQNIKKTDRIHGLFTLNGIQCTIAQPLRISRSGVRVPFGIPTMNNPNHICGFGLFLYLDRLERINARVRWTLACRWLDGGNTIIFDAGENADESLSAYQEKQIPLTGICFFILSSLVSKDTFTSACKVFEIKKHRGKRCFC